MVVDAAALLAQAGVPLPFMAGQNAPFPPPRAAPPDPSPALSAKARMQQTAPPGLAAPRHDPLPFARSATPAGGHAAATPPPSPPTPGSPPPGEGQANARAMAFTLAQYARLCAELRADPDSAPQLRASYGIDDPTWTALHTVWQTRFRENPTLKFRWEKQVEQILARLRAGG